MILFKPDLLSIGNKATERLTPFHLKTFGNNLSEFLLVLQDRDMEDQFFADPPPANFTTIQNKAKAISADLLFFFLNKVLATF